MKISNYDFNLAAYDNLKGNLIADRLAQNRWGSKFKKLYIPYKDEENRFDFTQGMHNCAGTDVEGILEELQALKAYLYGTSKLSDDAYATSHSYFAMLCKKRVTPSHPNILEITDVKFSLCLPVSVSEDDSRAVSLFFQRNAVDSDAIAYLEPINSYFERKVIVDSENSIQKPYYVTNKLYLKDEEGNEYGHVGSEALLKEGTTFNTIFSIYGVEQEDNTLFFAKENYSNRFNQLFENYNFQKYLDDFVGYSLSWEKHNPPLNNFAICVVFGTELLLSWLNEKIASWSAYLANINQQRTGIELELINHLNLCPTLQDEIGGHSGDISSIWFEFKKEVIPDILENNIANPNYKWWNEEQFDEIRKKFKKFYLYFDYTPGVYDDELAYFSKSYIIAKDSIFSLSGWKIYYLVSNVLAIDSRARSRSFLEQLFSFALLVVAIYLTAVTQNPAWLKMILITTTILSASGALSSKAQLAVAVLNFAYGAYNTNMSAMSGMELFQTAISNIEMVVKMVKMYENIKVEEDLKNQDDDNNFVYEEQDRAIEYIYTDAYSQYDAMYSIMYDFSPNYKTKKG